MIEAVVFDMDGVLIDTEPLWRICMIDTFARVGLHLTEDDCLETMGVRIADVVALWYARRPWQGPSVAEVTRWYEDAVLARVRAEGEPKPGACDALKLVRDAGLPAAIASSSSERFILTVMRCLNIEEYISVYCSADDEVVGKPDPAVYLTASRKLGTSPEMCLAIEDSANGVLAAKAAGMYCLAIPDPLLVNDPRIQRADKVLGFLEEFTPELFSHITGQPQRRHPDSN